MTKNKLLYLAHTGSRPDWISKVVENKKDFLHFDPSVSVLSQLEDTELVDFLCDYDNFPFDPEYAQSAWRLDPMLFQPLTEDHLRRFKSNELQPSIDYTFRDLYFLLRTTVLCLDLASDGSEAAQAALYAWMWRKPVLGISFSYVHSPWLYTRCNAVVIPATSDDILRHVNALVSSNGPPDVDNPRE